MAVDSGSIYSEVRIQLDKLRGDIKQVQITMDKLGPISKRSSDTVAKNWTTGFNQIKFISAAAFAAVGLAVKAAVSTFAGFEQSLANVQSVARATDEEFGRLSDAAKEMGETTRFTASQAADALYFLASAGLDATQSIDALEGVMNLAGATQSDLAFTSEAVASALSQFSLDARESTRVANVFTASIQNSQATMHKLATSMAIVGPVASAFGHSIEETSAHLQILYNSGIDASTAGTALRRAMSDLANATSPVIKKLAQFGVAAEEVSPVTNTFAEVIERLSEAGIEAEEVMAIFGQRAGASMVKLIEAGRESIEDYTEAVTDTNAAAEAYAVQNDTLAGSFDRLKSATESAQISFIQNIAPALRGLTDIMTGLVKLVGNLPGPIQVLLGVLAVGVPTVLAAGSAIAFMTTALAGAGIVLGTILGPITLVVGALGLVAAGITATAKSIRESEADMARYNALIDDAAKAMEGLTLQQQLNERAFLVSKRSRATREMLDILRDITDFRLDMSEMAAELGTTTEELEKMFVAAGDDTEALYEMADAVGITAAEIGFVKRAMESARPEIVALQERVKIAHDEVMLLDDALEEVDRAMVEAGESTGDLTGEIEEQSEAVRELSERHRVWNELQRKGVKIDEDKARILRLLETLESDRADDRQEEFDDREYIRDLNLRVLAAEQQAARERDRLNAERIAGMDALTEAESHAGGMTAAQTVARIANLRRLAERIRTTADEEKRAAEEKVAQALAQEALNSALTEYDEKLLQLTGSQEDLIAAEKARVTATLAAAGVSVEAIQEVLDKIDEFYEVVADDAAAKEFADAIKQSMALAFDHVEQLGDLILDIIGAVTDHRIKEIDRQLQAELEANGLAEESTVERYQRELEAARLAGDEEEILLAEQNLKRAQIEEEYERKRADLEYKGALNSWRMQLVLAIAQSFQAALNAYSAAAAIDPFILAPIAAGIAAAFGATQVGLIASTKPKPPRLATGGMVLPSRGGVLTVQAENDYPEMSLNAGPEGRGLRRMFARDIADLIGSSPLVVQLDIDGLRVSEAVVDRVNNGQVRLKL